MKETIVIGLVGEIASGKDAIGRFLQKEYGVEIISFSQLLRDILNILGLPQNRENMVWLGVDLRNRFGQNVLGEAIFNQIQKSQAKLVCLPNVRIKNDIVQLKDDPNFHLISVIADPRVRYNRLLSRGQNSDDAAKTWEEFLADSLLPTEVTIKELAEHAEFSIENNACLAHLFKQVRNIMKVIMGEKT